MDHGFFLAANCLLRYVTAKIGLNALASQSRSGLDSDGAGGKLCPWTNIQQLPRSRQEEMAEAGGSGSRLLKLLAES
jgi:hypothetical protein